VNNAEDSKEVYR